MNFTINNTSCHGIVKGSQSNWNSNLEMWLGDCGPSVLSWEPILSSRPLGSLLC